MVVIAGTLNGSVLQETLLNVFPKKIQDEVCISFQASKKLGSYTLDILNDNNVSEFTLIKDNLIEGIQYMELDLSDLAKGNYTVLITADDQRFLASKHIQKV